MQHHGICTKINTEPVARHAHAKIGVHIVNEDIFIEKADEVKDSQRDEAPGRDNLSLVLHVGSASSPWAVEEIAPNIYIKWIGADHAHILNSLACEGCVSFRKLIDHAGSRFAIVVQRENPLEIPVSRPANGLIVSMCKALVSFIKDQCDAIQSLEFIQRPSSRFTRSVVDDNDMGYLAPYGIKAAINCLPDVVCHNGRADAGPLERIGALWVGLQLT